MRVMHPKSLANLQGGRQPWTPERRARRVGDHVSPETRKRISSAGARARAAKYLADIERTILRLHGPKGLAIYRKGRRDGSNKADLKWRKWYEQAFPGRRKAKGLDG